MQRDQLPPSAVAWTAIYHLINIARHDKVHKEKLADIQKTPTAAHNTSTQKHEQRTYMAEQEREASVASANLEVDHAKSTGTSKSKLKKDKIDPHLRPALKLGATYTDWFKKTDKKPIDPTALAKTLRMRRDKVESIWKPLAVKPKAPAPRGLGFSYLEQADVKHAAAT